MNGAKGLRGELIQVSEKSGNTQANAFNLAPGWDVLGNYSM